MIVKDRSTLINDVMNKIFNYINSNLNLKKDLDDYYKMTGTSKDNKRILNNQTINYIFERRLGKNKKSIFDYVLEGLRDLTEEERNLINSLRNSINGVFEVRKITHNKFELFNILNEKLYEVLPLERMVKFRNLSVGHFILARIIKLDDEYVLYHVVDHINYPNRIVAFQIAVSRLAQEPYLFYFDNDEKLEELKENSVKLEEKFVNMFENNMVTTSSKYVDTLIGLINDYIEKGKKPAKTSIEKSIKPLKESSYFDINELRDGKNILVEAKKGFASQNKEYNVTLFADKISGLHVVPFMDIFLKVFEKDDYKKVKNYKECVSKFVNDAKITPLALQFANEKYPDIFIERINEILKTNYNSLDEILEKNKRFYIDNPYTSSTMTLYSSYAFKRLIEVIDETDNKKQEKIKVGRNDLCPCGSGLKYKKCCGKTVQI